MVSISSSTPRMFVKWQYIVISGHLSWVVLENPIKKSTKQKGRVATALYNYIVKKLHCLPGKTIIHSLNVSELGLHIELKLKLIICKTQRKFSKFSHQKNKRNVL